MFKQNANAMFNNTMFSSCTLIGMHETMERLYKAARELKDVDGQSAVARLLGESPQLVKNWESRGISKGGMLNAQKIIGCDATWLATGRGHMTKSNISPGPDIKGNVPKISWVQAGDFCDTHDFFEPGQAKDWLPCPVKHGPRTYALQVDGSSMDSGDRDGYPDGYDIFVDPDVEARHGDDVVVRTPNGRATFKRLQISQDGSYLLALNPQWPNRIIPVPEGTVICGVVIYSGRSRR